MAIYDPVLNIAHFYIEVPSDSVTLVAMRTQDKIVVFTKKRSRTPVRLSFDVYFKSLL